MPTYHVTIPDVPSPRVVQASTGAGARAHVAKDMTVRKIEVSEAFKLASDGVKLEVAGEVAEPETVE